MEMSSVRHKVTAKQWQQRILDQQSSGLSIRRWCSEQNIRESKYYYWLQILRSEELVVRQPTGIFAPLQLTGPAEKAALESNTGICAVIRNREISLEIHNGADPQTLAATLRAMGFLSK
jgi:hypothetical protein